MIPDGAILALAADGSGGSAAATWESGQVVVRRYRPDGALAWATPVPGAVPPVTALAADDDGGAVVSWPGGVARLDATGKVVPP